MIVDDMWMLLQRMTNETEEIGWLSAISLISMPGHGEKHAKKDYDWTTDGPSRYVQIQFHGPEPAPKRQ